MRTVPGQQMKQRIFRAHEARFPLAVLLAVLVGGIGLASQAKAADLSGNATLTTDYVWRGSTQTQGDPAAQAGIRIAGASGFYGAAWGSNVKFAPANDANAELDFTGGWTGALSDDWSADVNVTRYQYPATAVDLNWTELNGTLTYKGNYWASVGWSNAALGYAAAGTYTLVGAKFPVNDAFRLEAVLGHYVLDDAVVAEGGYTHGQLNAIWALRAPFELRVSAHATDANAKRVFGNDFAGGRVEAALQASF